MSVAFYQTANPATRCAHAAWSAKNQFRRSCARPTSRGAASRFEAPAFDFAGRKLLILGFGRIGRRLVKRCVAMEMEVLVHDYVV